MLLDLGDTTRFGASSLPPIIRALFSINQILVNLG